MTDDSTIHPDPLIAREVAIDMLQGQLATAHAGLLRALEFQSATPHGLAVKRDVRWALRESGFVGELGSYGGPPWVESK